MDKYERMIDAISSIGGIVLGMIISFYFLKNVAFTIGVSELRLKKI
jgi:hypothetical protein